MSGRYAHLAENAVVRARINKATKTEAAAVLAIMDLSLSDAFRLLLKRGAAERALPFEPLVPNAETVAAMKAARRGELVTVGKPAPLLVRPECGWLDIRSFPSAIARLYRIAHGMRGIKVK